MSDAARTVRVLIADDHFVVREGLRTILGTEDDLECVGEAANGQEAIDRCAELRPDVVLMDLRMPVLPGLEAIAEIKRRWPEVAVVILTTYDDDENIVRGLRAGACGYLLKETGREALFGAIRAAARGESTLPAAVAAKVFAHLASPRAADEAAHGALSEREAAVLRLVAQGLRNKEIAVRLGLSERTIKAYVTGVFNKLGVDSRAEATAVAMREGLLRK
ncbi:MAG: response regulator transcription factor [Chloroflexi bacterium]|nr:response regulator transcription factor [Chloroflexota bacterium]MCL5107519.1 response regulator transcription factor [Chloroflexota bacterium]